jgi:hypothetical protein
VTQPGPYPQQLVNVRSGLIALSDGMRAYFQQWQVPAVITPVGWRYRTFQMNTQSPGGGSRVCLIPGKIDPSQPGVPKVLEAGTFTQPALSSPGPRMGPATSNTNNPRPLAAFHKIVSLSIWAVDPSDTSNDELQLAALENLLDWTYQAMHNAVDPVTKTPVGLANLELQDAVWTLPPVDRAFGRELVAYFVAHGPIFDQAQAIITPQAAIERGEVT